MLSWSKFRVGFRIICVEELICVIQTRKKKIFEEEASAEVQM